MNFLVAAANGTHVYRDVLLGRINMSAERSKEVERGQPRPLKQALPRSLPGNPDCLVPHSCGWLACLQPNGVVSIWDMSWKEGALPCEVPPQAGHIARCYFSSQGSFLVTWEHMTALRQEAKGEGRGRGKGFGRAENLSVWSLTRRPAGPEVFEVQIEKGEGKLGINVDLLDGRSGLLLRRVDAGLLQRHNVARSAQHAAQSAHAARGSSGDAGSAAQQMVLPGDQVIGVNGVTGAAQDLSNEIARAAVLKLQVKRGPGQIFAHAVQRFFAPRMSPLQWPPIQWTQDEQNALRAVTDEVLLLDGRTLQVLGRISVQHISQLNLSHSLPLAGDPKSCCFGTFSPAQSGSNSPAMIRFFNSCATQARPLVTKGLFSAAAWVTMKWEPLEGRDLLLLVHSSELTEDDLNFRTLHGHSANGLYLLRSGEREPVTLLSTSEEVLLDVQWCHSGPTPNGDDAERRSRPKRILMLQGPQPASVALVSYVTGKPVRRINLDQQMGVRNSISCDAFGRSFCVHVQSERGMGLSNEADRADLFDLRPLPDETVAHRAALAVARREREHVGPSVSSVTFSPDGRMLLANVQVELYSEVRVISALDGRQLFHVRLEGVMTAMWQPSAEAFAAPEFPVPEVVPEQEKAIQIETRDREWLHQRLAEGAGELEELEEALAAPQTHLLFEFTGAHGSCLMSSSLEEVLAAPRDFAMAFCQRQRRIRALQKKVREIEKLKAVSESALDVLQKDGATESTGEKVATEPDIHRELQGGSRAAPARGGIAGSRGRGGAQVEEEGKQLDLLERPPRMIFDVETEEGTETGGRTGDRPLQSASLVESGDQAHFVGFQNLEAHESVGSLLTGAEASSSPTGSLWPLVRGSLLEPSAEQYHSTTAFDTCCDQACNFWYATRHTLATQKKNGGHWILAPDASVRRLARGLAEQLRAVFKAKDMPNLLAARQSGGCAAAGPVQVDPESC
ncbi:unnamed protein product [Durusdinium trenchii]|uniref:Uncharacterized protein n=2 Tax=Durusdinium trenchii TaxID=1381693 RepID=A0ABP0PJS8_9DINO